MGSQIGFGPVLGLLGLPFPVVRARIVPASVFSRGQRIDGENGEGEEAPHARLEARLVRAYHESYATKRFGAAHTVELPDEEFSQADELTRRLIADPRTHAVVRPAFFWKDPSNALDIGIGVRAGALVRRSDKTNFTLTDLRATKSVSKSSRRLNASGNAPWKRELNLDYVLELALKVFVARSSGVPVNRAGIVHLSGRMVFDGDRDPAGFLEFVDLTGEVNGMAEAVRDRIRDLQARHQILLDLPASSLQGVQQTPPTDISRLYVLSDSLRDKLAELQITDLRDIPDDFNDRYPDFALTPIQRRQVTALKQDRLIVEKEKEEEATLEEALGRLVETAHGGRLSFFDLETIAPPVALIKGGRNGQTITLQFSNHAIGVDGNLTHDELLYDPYDEDPLQDHALGRWDKRLAEKILESLGPSGPIIVYNASFEKSRLRELIRRLREGGMEGGSEGGREEIARRLEGLLVDGTLRELADRLEGRELTVFAGQVRNVIGSDGLVKEFVEHLRTARGRGTKKRQPSQAALRLADEIEEVLKSDRFVDLLPLVRNHVYHPRFDGSFSIKSVLKALCDGKGYGDLEEIRDGEAATLVLEEMLDPLTTDERRREIRERLLAYCGRDTMAEIWVLKELFRAAGVAWPFHV